MKTDNIFDLLVIDDRELDTSGFDLPENVSAERIKSLVGDRLKESTPKKHRRKRGFILIAAAVIAGVIFTTGAAAGVLRNIFDGYVMPQSESFSVTSVPIDVESSDVNIVCDGVAGDEGNVFAAFTITRKDGSAFVDSVKDLTIKSLGDRISKVLKISTSGDSETYSVCEPADITYEFVDERTISAFAYIKESNICGRKITLKGKDIYAYRFVRAIYEPEGLRETGLSYYVVEEDENIQKYTDEYTPLLKENEVIRIDPDHCALSIMERYVIPLNYQMSFTVDHLPKIKSLLKEPTDLEIDGHPCRITELTSGGCSLSLSAETTDGSDFPLLMGGITIELYNGTVINAETHSYRHPYNRDIHEDDRSVIIGEYTLCDRKDGFRFTPVDPKDIRCVTINDTAVYCNEG